jgi:hypothetical protein
MAKINVLSGARIEQAFGRFPYRSHPNGRITIDGDWVSRNIVRCTLKKARNGRDHTTECHRLAKDRFEAVFEEIARSGLSGLIRTFDGIWVPRHTTWNPSKPLSRHSWGIAIDLNASTNGYGNGISPENRALNEIFNRFGFAWGGDWSPQSKRDAMHWELAVIEPLPREPEPVVEPSLILAVDRSDNGASQYSYHRLQNAKLENGRFFVDAEEICAIVGGGGASGNAWIREICANLGYGIVQVGDHLKDLRDPRLYVFVKKG